MWLSLLVANVLYLIAIVNFYLMIFLTSLAHLSYSLIPCLICYACIYILVVFLNLFLIYHQMDARTTGPSRGPGPIDRISDPGKATNGSSAVPEEKVRGLATSIESWEKPKMKKKRSAIKADMSSAGVSRTADTDRELKQGQHKFNNDGRARMASSPSFRLDTLLYA